MSRNDSRFFVGLVTSSDAGTYNIQIEPKGPNTTGLVQGYPLMQVFASTLGFKECPQYPTGARVLCYNIDGISCYIFGIIPQADLGNLGFFSRAALGTEDSNSQDKDCNTLGYKEQASKVFTANAQRPTDVVEGEYVVANELGVLIGLFQELAILKGSELAQVQCFLLDDLVRLVSHNFSHWTSMGEVNIWHDGKAIMAEYGATHLSRESLGIPQTSDKGEPMFQSDGEKPEADDSKDYYKIKEDERSKAIERLKIFVGRLGDFVHLYLARPDDDAKRDLSGEVKGNFDRGLLDAHISTDGRFSLRSVTSIAIEKTNWIRVPLRVRTPEDPKGDEVDDIEFEDKKPFEWDNQVKVEENPVGYFLQLRDCLAYVQDKYAYLNFEKYKKDFKFSKSSSDKEKNLSECKKIDPNTEFKFSDYKLRHSGIYLMDNGGMMIKDAWGSAIVMEGGDIYLQAAKDLVAQPLRHLVSKAGHSVSIAAKKHVDLSSTEEGFRLKTKKVQHFFAKDEGLIFQTDTSKQSNPMPDSEAYDQFGGILFKAKDAGVFTYGKKIYNLAKEDSLYKAKKKMMIESEDDDVWVVPEKNLYLMPTKDVLCAPSGQLIFATDGNAIFAGAGQTNIGQAGQIVGLVPHPGSLPAIMDGTVPVSAVTGAITAARTALDEVMDKLMSPFHEESKFDEVKFRWLKSDKYNLKDKKDCIPQTIAQQDDKAFGFLSLQTWTEEEEESTLPFPGKDKFEQYYMTYESKNLKTSSSDPKDYESKDYDALTEQAGTLKFESLNTYKIRE
jgi:hypothetical protein